jgi:AraC family transcriptional regulator
MLDQQARLNRVLDYIENNLDKPLTIDLLCDIACWSKYHFHRQCSAYFGMSVYQLIKLLRTKRAAFQLIYRKDIKVVDIALCNGFDSHQAFSRSFRQMMGMSPSIFRKSPSWGSWQQYFNDVAKLRIKTMSNTNYVIDIIDFPETQLAVFEHRGAPSLLGRSIQRFIAWRKRMSLPPSTSRTFNLVYDDPRTVAAEDYRFDLACEYEGSLINETGISSKVIPSGKCAYIRHVGSDDLLGQPIDYLYSDWLESCDWKLRDFPLFFERVSFFPEVAEAEMITDIYLPIT